MTQHLELESHAKLLLELSQGSVKRCGFSSPLVMVCTGEKSIMFNLPEKKSLWFPLIMMALCACNAESYLIAYLTWSVEKSQYVEGLPLSRNPSRMEHILVYGRERSGRAIMWMQQFLRGPHGITFEPVEVQHGYYLLQASPEKW